MKACLRICKTEKHTSNDQKHRVNRHKTTNALMMWLPRCPRRCSVCSGTSILYFREIEHLSIKSNQISCCWCCYRLRSLTWFAPLHCNALWSTLFKVIYITTQSFLRCRPSRLALGYWWLIPSFYVRSHKDCMRLSQASIFIPVTSHRPQRSLCSPCNIWPSRFHCYLGSGSKDDSGINWNAVTKKIF